MDVHWPPYTNTGSRLGRAQPSSDGTGVWDMARAGSRQEGDLLGQGGGNRHSW